MSCLVKDENNCYHDVFVTEFEKKYKYVDSLVKSKYEIHKTGFIGNQGGTVCETFEGYFTVTDLAVILKYMHISRETPDI